MECDDVSSTWLLIRKRKKLREKEKNSPRKACVLCRELNKMFCVWMCTYKFMWVNLYRLLSSCLFASCCKPVSFKWYRLFPILSIIMSKLYAVQLTDYHFAWKQMRGLVTGKVSNNGDFLPCKHGKGATKAMMIMINVFLLNV